MLGTITCTNPQSRDSRREAYYVAGRLLQAVKTMAHAKAEEEEPPLAYLPPITAYTEGEGIGPDSVVFVRWCGSCAKIDLG